MKLKIDVIDEDDGDEYDFVDHFEYQYSTRDLRREIDTAPKSLILKGSRTRFVYQNLFVSNGTLVRNRKLITCKHLQTGTPWIFELYRSCRTS